MTSLEKLNSLDAELVALCDAVGAEVKAARSNGAEIPDDEDVPMSRAAPERLITFARARIFEFRMALEKALAAIPPTGAKDG